MGAARSRPVKVETLLKVQDVAAGLGVCRATVYAMVQRGDLPHVRVGTTVRIRPEDLTTFLAPVEK